MFERLIDMALRHDLICHEDAVYTQNRLMEVLCLDSPQESEIIEGETIAEQLENLTEWAVMHGICQNTADSKERFNAKLAGCITPSPYQIREKFFALKKSVSSSLATDWFYNVCRNTDYIKTKRLAQNVSYEADTRYGRLEITYNLSKPEKDPRDIALALTKKDTEYPKCMLCAENPGYAGRAGFPARQNHRMIPLNLCNEKWYLQYSPYAYYTEHCIVLCGEHRPMRMTRDSFRRLFQFVEEFPHYFIGSNADLPIVGGSILNHDHFQGGNHVFPMEKAEVMKTFSLPGFHSVQCNILKWPVTCLSFVSNSKEDLCEIAAEILEKWRLFSDMKNDIVAMTGDEPHNAITPVVRKKNELYKLYMMLRNNRTSAEYPLGIFHPHNDLHHIKRENIGLIEALGLFILPGRLINSLADVKEYLMGKKNLPSDHPHYTWAMDIRNKLCRPVSAEDAAERIIREAVAETCCRVLEDTGVYKLNECGIQGLYGFIQYIGGQL